MGQLMGFDPTPFIDADKSLEQRVAALEAAVERLEHPLGLVEAPPQPELTDEQAAELREALETAATGAPRPLIFSSLPDILSPEALRQLLRECVTVVKPGEVLFFSSGDPNMTPNQMRELQDFISWWLAENAPDVKALVLPHGEMAAAESGPD